MATQPYQMPRYYGNFDPNDPSTWGPPAYNDSPAPAALTAPGGPTLPASGVSSTTSPGEMTKENRNFAVNQGNAILGGIGQAEDYYGGLQEDYRKQADTAYQSLAETPGYTPEEASQINVDYGQFRQPGEQLAQQYLTPDEQASIYGNPNAAVSAMETARTGMNEGTSAEGAMLNQYQAGVGGQLGEYQKNLSGQVDKYGTGVGGAVTGLKSGLDTAQGKFGKLDEAVNSSGLAFDPNSTMDQLTDQDVQNIKTSAGTRIGNQYRSAEDTLERQAAAAGNTSPLAMEAARARLAAQSSADQGDAELNADIAARQAQYERAADIESRRLGAVQTQQGMKANAATTEQSQAQNAAALSGTAGISAAEDIGQKGIDAANTYNQSALNTIGDYGKFATSTAGDMANKNYTAGVGVANAIENADTASSGRAAQIAGNRQGVYGNILNTQYGQGMQTTEATSQGAQTVGNARQAGMGQYRNYLTGQQQQAQTGQLTSQGQQANVFGTQMQGLSSAAGTQEQNKNATPGWMKGVQAVGSVLGGHSTGAVITKPEVARVGERGPEMVIPIGRYRKAA